MTTALRKTIPQRNASEAKQTIGSNLLAEVVVRLRRVDDLLSGPLHRESEVLGSVPGCDRRSPALIKLSSAHCSEATVNQWHIVAKILHKKRLPRDTLEQSIFINFP